MSLQAKKNKIVSRLFLWVFKNLGGTPLLQITDKVKNGKGERFKTHTTWQLEAKKTSNVCLDKIKCLSANITHLQLSRLEQNYEANHQISSHCTAELLLRPGWLQCLLPEMTKSSLCLRRQRMNIMSAQFTRETIRITTDCILATDMKF